MLGIRHVLKVAIPCSVLSFNTVERGPFHELTEESARAEGNARSLFQSKRTRRTVLLHKMRKEYLSGVRSKQLEGR